MIVISDVYTPNKIWRKFERSFECCLGNRGIWWIQEELKRAGNDKYKRGNFLDALYLYDKAIAISAAALTGLGRFMEAVRECEEAVCLDPGYCRAHQRLASLHLKLGHVEIARKHISFQGQHPDPTELQKCIDSRRIGDWKNVLRECDAAIAAGAESSPKSEALLKLHQLDDADSCLGKIPRFEPLLASFSQTKFFGMLSNAYIFFARAQVEMALGRFENVASAAKKAGLIDHRNAEVAVMLNIVRLVERAHARVNDLFNSGKYAEACSYYGEDLKSDTSNSVLHCNRAVCWSKHGNWERSVEDCNQALNIHPKYTKALRHEAASYGKCIFVIKTCLFNLYMFLPLPSGKRYSTLILTTMRASHGLCYVHYMLGHVKNSIIFFSFVAQHTFIQ
ncbi:hypothetical protein MKW92_048396, partial [Papaver armeniacum]